jgi:hypothetical protein
MKFNGIFLSISIVKNVYFILVFNEKERRMEVYKCLGMMEEGEMTKHQTKIEN